MVACEFCGSDVESHDPVRVEHGGESFAFCNWACLREYVDAESLVRGACCHVDAGGDA